MVKVVNFTNKGNFISKMFLRLRFAAVVELLKCLINSAVMPIYL